MSKKKLLIHEVFKKAKEESQRDTKNGLASYLWLYFKEDIGFEINDKSFSRYYDTYIIGDRDINIQPDRLNKLSEYLGYKDFADFSKNFVKKDEDANKTTVKITVDDEDSLTEKISKVIINITNEQHFKVPDFIKQNGLGILEMTFVLLLVTGGVFFSKGKAEKSTLFPLTFMSGIDSAVEKSYMYWDGERYIATDSSYISPEFDVVAINEHQLKFLRRITRKDTMTVENSIGRTWYSKCYGEVEFFTADGIDPDTKTELRKSSSYIIDKYAGKNAEPLLVEE
ncbi:hypothetical protein [Chryseobacterium sp. Leaf201]|uniref:hypothetical protein n=1 Tax=Chryseobacterium sp. Leaf201 TaxID=1735672 RepID=UPI0006F9A820|nr:hypothetical protein [Chryseobacterium sp. Leaf201]KQM41720.1 hypothetical protein ASE55_03665 [Chryseobacterium sp. Leaf201]